MSRQCVIVANRQVLQVAPRLAAYWRALGDFRYGKMSTEAALALNTFLQVAASQRPSAPLGRCEVPERQDCRLQGPFVRYEDVVAGQKGAAY